MNLEDMILKTLRGQQLTLGQLIPQIMIEHHITHDQTNAFGCSVARTCARLVHKGVLVREMDSVHKLYRYSIPTPRYTMQSTIGGFGLYRGGVNIGVMKEAEALVCIAALNELDRKVRKLKG